MIEPTDEMVRAFMRAYADADDGSSKVILEDAAEKAGVAAVLAIVERDYRIEPRPPWEREGAICPVHHTQLRWGQCAECGLDEDDS